MPSNRFCEHLLCGYFCGRKAARDIRYDMRTPDSLRVNRFRMPGRGSGIPVLYLMGFRSPFSGKRNDCCWFSYDGTSDSRELPGDGIKRDPDMD